MHPGDPVSGSSAKGVSAPVIAQPGGCSPACDECTPVPCPPPYCPASEPVPAEGFSFDWHGKVWTQGTCGEKDILCVNPSCAPPGRYTARFCAFPLEGGGGDPIACEDQASSTPKCVEVPFDYPSNGPVVVELGPTR